MREALGILGCLASGRPFKLTFAVTYLCNSRCSYCSIWKRKPKGELGIEEIRKIGKNAGFVKWLNITGGEPFLRKDLEEIISSFPSASILNLTTNALVADALERIKGIRRSFGGRMVVTVSLDGDKETHDRLRGVPGNWEKAVNLLRGLREEGIESYFGFTIGPLNRDAFRRAVESVREFGFSVSDFHLNIYHHSFYYGNSPHFGWEKEAIKVSRDLAKFKKGLTGVVERAYLKRVGKYLLSRRTPIPCSAMKSSIFLDPFGNVFPCTMWARNLGNVREDGYDIMKILRKSSNVRDEIRKGKCPHCWTPCEAFPSLVSQPWFLL